MEGLKGIDIDTNGQSMIALKFDPSTLDDLTDPTVFSAYVCIYDAQTENQGMDVVHDEEPLVKRKVTTIKPPECAMISEAAKLLSAEKVAQVFVKGILKKKFNIYPGISLLFNIAKRLFPKLAMSIADSDLKSARKKLGKSTDY